MDVKDVIFNIHEYCIRKSEVLATPQVLLAQSYFFFRL